MGFGTSFVIRNRTRLWRGEGSSLSAAAQAIQSRSDRYVFFGYVDQLLLGEGPPPYCHYKISG